MVCIVSTNSCSCARLAVLAPSVGCFAICMVLSRNYPAVFCDFIFCVCIREILAAIARPISGIAGFCTSSSLCLGRSQMICVNMPERGSNYISAYGTFFRIFFRSSAAGNVFFNILFVAACCTCVPVIFGVVNPFCFIIRVRNNGDFDNFCLHFCPVFCKLSSVCFCALFGTGGICCCFRSDFCICSFVMSLANCTSSCCCAGFNTCPSVRSFAVCMTLCSNFCLCNENFVTNRAVFTFGKTCVYAVRLYRFINYFGVLMLILQTVKLFNECGYFRCCIISHEALARMKTIAIRIVHFSILVLAVEIHI